MAKPKRVRATTHPIGVKINTVLAEKGMPGNYGALAEAFEVALPSVYGWVEKGRIRKDRLPALAKWSGRPLSWWFDSEPSADGGESGELMDALQDWRAQASPKSQEVIDQLTMLAQGNALSDDDWALLESILRRFAKR